MAAFSQSLEAKIGAEKFARFRALIEPLVGTKASPVNLQKTFRLLAQVNVPRTTIAQYVKRGFNHATSTPVETGTMLPTPTDLAPMIPNVPLQSQGIVSVSSSILLRDNARLKRQLAERDAGWEIIKEVLEEVYVAPSNIQIIAPKESVVPGSPEVAVMHVTDVHYGKITPTYDIAVTETRMLKYFQAVSEIVELRRQVAPIDRGKLLLGGDMIEGEGIFPSQAWETQVDLVSQMVKDGPEYAVTLVLSLLQLFPTLEVEAVPGNHGRQGKFGSPRNNADSVFYEIVRKMVEKASPEESKRVTWNLPLDRPRGDQWYSRFNILAHHEGMLVHGDQIKGTLGFPWYGYGKKVNGWRNANGTRGFSFLWGGHFHTHATFDLNDATILSTGSPESSNGYALENMAAAGEPKQRLSFFNERFGLLSDYPISLL